MDAIDRRILNELQRDGRIGNNALAERVGLSESACLRRVKKLESDGIIAGYTAIADAAKLGKPGSVFVRVTLQKQDKECLRTFEQEVRKVPEVMECYLMSGESDYLLRVAIENNDDYERIHTDHLTCLPGVERVQSSFALRTVEKKYVLPPGRD